MNKTDQNLKEKVKSRVIVLVILISTNAYSQFPIDPTQVSIDLKVHCLGLGQIVTNLGFGSIPYPNYLMPEACPPGESNIIDDIQLPGAIRCAIFLGAKRGTQKIFSSSEWESCNIDIILDKLRLEKMR